jgi:hypothetical protein
VHASTVGAAVDGAWDAVVAARANASIARSAILDPASATNTSRRRIAALARCRRELDLEHTRAARDELMGTAAAPSDGAAFDPPADRGEPVRTGWDGG